MNIRLLYWSRSWDYQNNSQKNSLEYHPYCQLEICARGTIAMYLEEKNHLLQAGDMILIPPGTGHRVVYPDSDNEFYSLKFESSEAPAEPVIIQSSNFSSWCISSFGRCHTNAARSLLPIDPETREIIEGLLLLCVRKAVHSESRNPQESEIARKIRETTLRNGYCLNVAECAKLLDMTPAQLNYQFNKESKLSGADAEANSVKQVIDEALLYLINRYLDFTDFPLTTISEQLKFNNVYTFSRFYKRLTGVSPSRRRLAALTGISDGKTTEQDRSGL